MRSSVVGAMGDAGASLVNRRCSNMTVACELGGDRLLAGVGSRIITGGHAACVILGSPRLAPSASGGQPGDPDTIDAWQSVLLGPAAAIDARLTGHFAVAYMDLAHHHIVLATDRFGSYSLYFRVTNDGFAFADRADMLFDEKPSLSAQALFDYLYFHCLPGPGTIHEEVERLEPGEIVRWENDGLTRSSYWGRRARGPAYVEFSWARDDFHRVLRTAVAAEVEAGTTGAFLSGGTDSSTVVGVLAEHSASPIKSYSIGFDVDGYDEAGYAKLAAERFGSDHRTYYITPDDLVAHIPSVAARLDQPFGNSSLLPAMICAERAREDGITKLLAGDGGDELFGGNTRYAKQKVFDWYEGIPSTFRSGLIEPITRRAVAARVPLLSKVKSYVEQASLQLPDRLETYNTIEREGPGAMLPEAWLADVDTDHPRTLQRQVWSNLKADNLIDRMLEFDWKFTLADNDLRKVRYAADMAGIHVGFPLLSDELVDFSMRLPPDWKVKGLKLRWFFKRALTGFLPEEIIRKKKHGFGLPFGNWALEHAELRRMATDAIQGLVGRGFLRGSYAKWLMESQLRRFPSYYGELVWVLMMLEYWLQSHSPDWRAGRQVVS